MFKKTVPLLLLMISWISPIIYLTYRVDNYTAQIEENNKAIYDLLFYNNSTQFIIMETEGRILHYLCKHDPSKDPITGCPECGVIKQLTIRKMEISEEMTDPSISTEKANKLFQELNSIDKHIYYVE